MDHERRPRRHGPRFYPQIETLEDRTAPALVASQFVLVVPPPPTLMIGSGMPFNLDPTNEVDHALQAAAAATSSTDAIIAVVDRGGNILGVRVEGGVSPLITGNPALLTFAVDGALAEARTAAFFANDTAPLTARTVGFISQSTVTEREVKSNPNIPDPNSPLRGPGFVAPIRLGAHFPPGVAFTPPVDLFGIEHTNRDSIVHPGADRIKGTADDVLLPGRFNSTMINPDIRPPLSYGEAILTPAQLANPATAKTQARGIGTLPGGIPIYKDGPFGKQLVGGIGVFFPGTTGFASEENSSLSADFDPTKPDRSLEAEFMAFVGSTVLTLPPLDDRTGLLPRIDLVGITLDTIGPGGEEGVKNLKEAVAGLNPSPPGSGNPVTGMNLPVNSAGTFFVTGIPVPDGYLIPAHDGVGITAADVQRIIQQGIDEANITRAQIRLPLGNTARMVFAVADRTGEILGLFRMPDATFFSIDVAVAKARNVAYYNDATKLQPQDTIVTPGVAFTNRTFRFVAGPRFPDGIDGNPSGPFSILNDPGINPTNGRLNGPPPPASAYQSVYGFDAFNPGTNFRDMSTLPQNQNGIVFFPGSSGVYKGGLIVGGFGVSGDGVDQDDVVTSFGIVGYDAPFPVRADLTFVRGVRLPYFKYPRNPEGL